MDVADGPAVLDLLPVLAKALAGEGPAWLPVPVSGPERHHVMTALKAGEALTPVEDDTADPTAFVLATSGSTGTPKGALLPVGALRASIEATAARLGPEEEPGQWLLALAAHHIAGLQVLLRSVAAGTEPVVLDLTESFDPARFVRAAAAMTGPRKYVSLVPTQLARVLTDPTATAALAEFDAVLVGGAAAARPMLATAADAGIAIVTTYGMSETCGGCVYDGRPLAGVEVRVEGPIAAVGKADEVEAVGAVGAVGAVSLHGPVVARGYRSRPGDPSFGPGAFRTGDLGRLVDGTLTITGRADDVIITGGLKVEPSVLEATLGQIAGVAAVGVCGVPDPEWGQALVCAIVPIAGHHVDAAEVRRVAATAHGRFAAPKYVLVVAQLPLRGIGKPDRMALTELVLRRLAGDRSDSGADRRSR